MNKKLIIFFSSLFLLASCEASSSNFLSSTLSSQSSSSLTSTYPFIYPPATSSSIKDVPEITSDPYVNVDVEEFYANYTPAISYQDSVYRTEHNLMSGSIDSQNELPYLAYERPMDGDKYIRNTNSNYSEDGNTYYVLNYNGDVAFEIYRGGAYVTLEEVAAYVFAFHDIPANYVRGKTPDPTLSPWGIYLRGNNSRFSGDTTKYPYEPELPYILSGELIYYEIDIGTTGTTSDPNYMPYPYNDGKYVTRGAARIVYTRSKAHGEEISDPNEGYVFYTYNHYNDFQEYLNYQGGWGEMFGNITGGGELSSKENYNPTPYVEVTREDF